MAIPTTTPFSEYSGLYLSCRTFRAEMDNECGKILKSHLYTVKAQMEGYLPEMFPSIQFPVSEAFLQMQHIRVDFSQCRGSDCYYICDRFSKLMYPNRFASITFIMPDNCYKSDNFLTVCTRICVCIGRILGVTSSPFCTTSLPSPPLVPGFYTTPLTSSARKIALRACFLQSARGGSSFKLLSERASISGCP